MDHLGKLQKTIRQYLLIIILFSNALLIALWWGGIYYLQLSTLALLISSVGLAIFVSIILSKLTTDYVSEPLTAVWQAVLHLSPSIHGVAAPQVDDLHLGQELVATLTSQIYQLADVGAESASSSRAEFSDINRNFVAQNLPLPFIVVDANETVQFANEAAASYIGLKADDMIGKNVYMVLDMSFPSEDTLDAWLKTVKSNKATAVQSWERVKLNVRDNHPTRLFDLAAYYNRDNNQHLETMLVLFDHTKQYSQDDQAVSFIALSVHELRTPLTLLRGYIEVFQEELEGKVSPELADFMVKMNASSQQLMAFVNNILNVARVDDDQLQLQLKEENWGDILRSSLETLSLRAGVRGITLQYSVAKNLPTVGVDRLSIFEVINNLVDNAIKYSGNSKVIKIRASLTKDGMVETTVQDFGGGIPTSVIPNLFTKFYRDHHNRAQIGGTGLGLYLSKSIVTAHGGNVWVRSLEGQGSTFGFTLLPYSKLAEEVRNNDNQEIVRGAHGWIKNHSLYRR